MATMRQLCADLEKVKEIVDGMCDRDLRSRLHQIVDEAYRIKGKLHALAAKCVTHCIEHPPEENHTVKEIHAGIAEALQ